jgi:hypothetical protein
MANRGRQHWSKAVSAKSVCAYPTAVTRLNQKERLYEFIPESKIKGGIPVQAQNKVQNEAQNE